MNKTISFWVALSGALIVAAISIGLSFAALTDLGVRGGMNLTAARFWAIVIDALVLTSIAAVASLSGWRYAYSWFLLAVSEGTTLASNWLHAALPAGEMPTNVAGAIAVVPPLAAIATVHLAIMLGHEAQARQEMTHDAAAPAPVIEEKFGRAVASLRRMRDMAVTAATAEPAPVASVAEAVAAPLPVTHTVAVTQVQPVTQTLASVSQPDVMTQTDAADAVTQKANVVAVPTATPEPVRQEAVALVAQGESGHSIARTLNISEATVRRIKKRAIEAGELIQGDDGTLSLAQDAASA